MVLLRLESYDIFLNNDFNDHEEVKNIVQEKSVRASKEAGRWGEEYVFKALKERFKDSKDQKETDFGFRGLHESGFVFEIKWLNKPLEIGVGCDFIILQDGVGIEYIEVKSKRDENYEMVEVTGTQWEFARQLYDQGDGDKYFFYVVQNAGKKSGAKIKIIQNPIDLWRTGKLYAHPIYFKI